MRKTLFSLGITAMTAMAGCGGDTAGPAPAEQTYWALTLNTNAVALSLVAPYDTLQLTATPRTFDGTPIPGGGPVRYRVARNDTSVLIGANGLLQAHVATPSAIWVYATQTIGKVTLSDSLLVSVDTVAHPAQLATFGLELSTGGTTLDCNTNFFQSPQLLATPQDANGQAIPNVPVRYGTSNDEVVQINVETGVLRLACDVKNQEVTLYATTTAFGVHRTDSLHVSIPVPSAVGVAIRKRVPSSGAIHIFEPQTVSIPPGGTVVWVNFSGDSVDVVFDDPASAQATTEVTNILGVNQIQPGLGNGDILEFPSDTAGGFFASLFKPDNYRARRFVTAGSYTYRNPDDNTTGTIVVQTVTP